jgi:hypothetical protein
MSTALLLCLIMNFYGVSLSGKTADSKGLILSAFAQNKDQSRLRKTPPLRDEVYRRLAQARVSIDRIRLVSKRFDASWDSFNTFVAA